MNAIKGKTFGHSKSLSRGNHYGRRQTPSDFKKRSGGGNWRPPRMPPAEPAPVFEERKEVTWRGQTLPFSQSIGVGDLCIGEVKVLTDKCVKFQLICNLSRRIPVNKWARLYIHNASDRFLKIEEFCAMFSVGDVGLVEICGGTLQKPEITLQSKYCGAINASCPSCGIRGMQAKCANCAFENSKKYANVKRQLNDGVPAIVAGAHKLQLF